MNGARIVVEMLIKFGTDVIFGVPGDTSLGLHEAHRRAFRIAATGRPGAVHVALADVLGLKSCHVNTAADLDKAVNDSFKHDGPAFIDVVSLSEDAELPPVFSWERADREKRI